jgi:hypothetical protein
MVLSLIFVREHYTVITKNIFEPAVKKLIECNEKYGENKVCGLLNISNKVIEYYENKYNQRINNCYVDYNLSELCRQLENENAEYLVAANLDDYEMYCVKKYYPYMIDYSEYIGAEVYVMSKNKGSDCIVQEPIFERTYDLSGYNAEEDLHTLIDTPFTALSTSRFVKLEVEMSYIQEDTADDFGIALQVALNEHLFAKRRASVKDFSVAENESVKTIIIPMRYELVFKDSQLLRSFTIKSYIWNPDHTKSVHPISARIRMIPDNRYIYSFMEDVK